MWLTNTPAWWKLLYLCFYSLYIFYIRKYRVPKLLADNGLPKKWSTMMEKDCLNGWMGCYNILACNEHYSSVTLSLI